ncbi:hypothetical protein V6767_20095 [Martelella sp. FLE1502]
MKPVIPASNQPIASRDGFPTPLWVRFFNALIGPAEAIAPISAPSSPTVIAASQSGSLSILGGTVSAISLKRARVTIDVTGAQFVPVATGDVVTITHSSSPTVHFIPD